MSTQQSNQLSDVLSPSFQPGKLAVGFVFSSFLVVVLWSWSFLGLSLGELAVGFSKIGSFLVKLWPADFSASQSILSLGFETLVMAAVGTNLGMFIGVALAFVAAHNTGFPKVLSSLARFVIIFFRSIPDLVLAILIVALIGIGPAAGALALGLGSIGMIGRVTTEAIEESKLAPVQALRSSGAKRSQVLASGFLPQITPALVSLFLYRLDINFRAATLLGLVGAGGIGILLRISLGTLDYQAAFAVIIFIFALVGVIEFVSVKLRKILLQPAGSLQRRSLDKFFVRFSILIFGLTVLWGGVSYSASVVSAFSRVDIFIDMLLGFLTPDFITRFDLLLKGLLETIAISAVGTFLGLFVGIPIGFLAARTTELGKFSYLFARTFLVLKRGFPTLIIALIFVSAIGLGPMAGVLAMMIGTGGALAKFIADSLEEVPMKPVQAIATNGASRFQQIAAGILPQVSPTLIGHIAYSLDMNIRYAAVLGIVGAGGIGTVVLTSVKNLDYQTTSASILVLFALLVVIDRTSRFIRSKLR